MPATGAVRFKVGVGITNLDIWPEIRARMKDMSVFFGAVIEEWRKHNVTKFNLSRGAEESGATFTPEPFWEPLTPGYIKQKRKAHANWLMVRTGALRAALTTEDLFFKMVEPQQATFGSPIDPEEFDKMRYNWEKRQTVFLDEHDMRVINLFANDFITLGPKFREIKAAAALEKMRMDAEFEATMAQA